METCLIIIIVIGIVFAIIKNQIKVDAARRAALMERYNDADIVERIMSKSFWQGQSRAQLKDSLGAPEYVDTVVLKSKRKEVWKYNRRSANRYGLKITLEDDVVVGWDQK